MSDEKTTQHGDVSITESDASSPIPEKNPTPEARPNAEPAENDGDVELKPSHEGDDPDDRG